MKAFTTQNVAQLAQQRGLIFPSYVIAEVVAALDAGKHIMLTGPPGTGKTSLAYVAADAARQAVLCTGHLAVTASSDWGIGETVGRYTDSPEGAVFQPGVFLQALESGAWLVIDELNRADFDTAFGPLFTVLANQSVTLPFKQAGHSKPISIVPTHAPAPPDTEEIRVPADWRMIATMNEFDKETLYRLAYALMRRFAFIEVEAPSDDVIRALVQGPGEVVADLLPVRKFVELGPAVFVDAARYAARRAEDPDTSRSRVVFETFYSYLLPQLDQLDDRDAKELFDALAPLLDAPELNSLRRAVRKVLGSGAADAVETARRRPAAHARPLRASHTGVRKLS